MRTKIKLVVIALSICISIQAQNSALSSGTWYKLEVTQDGLYKINYPQLLAMGMSGKNPKNIKLYGYGGILPQLNSDFRYEDLAENPIVFKGEEDGVLNEGDYILFYGEGPNTISESNETLVHEKNPYAQASYYFVSYSDVAGKRIQEKQETSNFETSKNTLPYLTFYEEETSNIVKSGREWVGNPFRYKPTQTFNFQLHDILSNSDVNFASIWVGGSFLYPTSFTTSINGSVIGTKILPAVTSSYGAKVIEANHSIKTKTPNTSLSVTSVFNNSGDGSAIGYLDYIRIVYERMPKGDKTIAYTILAKDQNTNIELTNVSTQTQVWDVTRVDQIQQLPIVANQVAIDSNIYKILILNQLDALSPNIIGQVSNQNIRQIAVPELLIVTHSSFMEVANAFKEFKETKQGISTQIVAVDQIYNEFSSGKQDISAIRDFAKHLYKRDSKLKYLMLLGDCSYDYLNRLPNNTNYVPVYESRASYSNTASFSSDDYFGFFGEDEGTWSETANSPETTEIGIGRLPIQSNQEGYEILNKINQYLFSTQTEGNWRTKAIFVADDGDNQLHTEQSNQLSLELEEMQKGMNINRIFLDAFEQISSAGGEVSPNANQELKRRIEKGALIVNFSGHGSEDQWTQEEILTTGDINQLKNIEKMPFFITATCEFGRYDDPSARSGGEALLMNPSGGAIALMTTTRPVYASSNLVINSSFYQNAFLRNEDLIFDNLGDIFKRTKNQSIVGYSNRNFALLGDPSIKLAYPDWYITLDSLNGEIITKEDTVSALQNINIKGKVKNQLNQESNLFNGRLVVTVYDKESQFTTLGDGGEKPFRFSERTSIIFEGEVEVIDGNYEIEFVVPKDISYSYGLGKISMYAVNSQGQNASGYDYNVVIGGGLDGFDDTNGPMLELFANDTTFVSGGVVGENMTFLAEIFDKSGVNTTNTGIGHEMTLTIDGDIQQVYVLNDYYTSIDNTYKKGKIEFPLYDLASGTHTLSLKVWDVNNNSSTQEIMVNVSDKGLISAFPNPFNDKIYFYINQPREDVSGQLEIKIYTLYGIEIWSQTTDFESIRNIEKEVYWDGKSINGENNSSGIYVSVVELRYRDGEGNIKEKSKLILQK